MTVMITKLIPIIIIIITMTITIIALMLIKQSITTPTILNTNNNNITITTKNTLSSPTDIKMMKQALIMSVVLLGFASGSRAEETVRSTDSALYEGVVELARSSTVYSFNFKNLVVYMIIAVGWLLATWLGFEQWWLLLISWLLECLFFSIYV